MFSGGYGMSEEHIAPVVAAIASDQTRWVDFMMKFRARVRRARPEGGARNSAVDDRGGLTYSAGWCRWRRTC